MNLFLKFSKFGCFMKLSVVNCQKTEKIENFSVNFVLFALFTLFFLFDINIAHADPTMNRVSSAATVNLEVGDSQIFTVEAAASAGIYAIEWFVGSVSQKYTSYTSSWDYYQQETWARTFNAAGIYTISAYVYDRYTNQREAFVTWAVNVSDSLDEDQVRPFFGYLPKWRILSDSNWNTEEKIISRIFPYSHIIQSFVPVKINSESQFYFDVNEIVNTELIELVHLANKKILFSLGHSGEDQSIFFLDKCSEGDDICRQAIDELVTKAKDFGFDGIDVDYES